MPQAAGILLLAALIPVAAGALPPADFTYFPDHPRPAEAVVFEATYDPDVAYRSWNFGDGTPTQENIRIPQHAFAHAGRYTVILTVKDSQGLPNQTSRLVSVSEPGPPVADFTVTVQSGSRVSFQDLSTDPDDNIVTWIWDFGDGVRHAESSLLGQTITRAAQHAYGAPGSYTATLTVEDADGNRSQKSRTLSVMEGASTPASGYAPMGTSPSLPPQNTASPLFGQILNPPGSQEYQNEKVVEWVFKFAIAVFVLIGAIALIARKFR